MEFKENYWKVVQSLQFIMTACVREAYDSDENIHLVWRPLRFYAPRLHPAKPIECMHSVKILSNLHIYNSGGKGDKKRKDVGCHVKKKTASLIVVCPVCYPCLAGMRRMFAGQIFLTDQKTNVLHRERLSEKVSVRVLEIGRNVKLLLANQRPVLKHKATHSQGLI